MIFLGYSAAQKDAEVARYCAERSIKKVVVFSPEQFRFECSFTNHEHITYSEIIQYRFYYRLIQETDNATLLIINECLRTQNRYDLTYNCLRNFLNQTTHQIIFQNLPVIDTIDDSMVLFDFDTRSRWKRERFDARLLQESEIRVQPVPLELRGVSVETNDATKMAYAKEKRRLIDGIGPKDPHTIPRSLYLMSGKAKLEHVDTSNHYVGRNNRFGLKNLHTYREPCPKDHTIFELPHRFIDFSDFITLSGQARFDVLVADLKVDQWYWQRYHDWVKRVEDAGSILRS